MAIFAFVYLTIASAFVMLVVVGHALLAHEIYRLCGDRPTAKSVRTAAVDATFRSFPI